MSKVFMDGGSGLNLIFATTLRAMNISMTNLEATDTSFHDIILGKPEVPLGKIGLIFGTRENYQRERIEFEVVDWPSQYHAILGRPAFARFMAVPHYAYLMLKMPGPRGTITVRGSFTRSDICDKDFNKISEFFGMLTLACRQTITSFPTHERKHPKRSSIPAVTPGHIRST